MVLDVKEKSRLLQLWHEMKGHMKKDCWLNINLSEKHGLTMIIFNLLFILIRQH